MQPQRRVHRCGGRGHRRARPDPAAAERDVRAGTRARARRRAVGHGRAQQRDATARRRLVEELRDSRAELALRQREDGIRAERARIAREIHDTLAQELSGSRMLLQAAERDRRRSPETAWAGVRTIADALGDNLAETRRILDTSADRRRDRRRRSGGHPRARRHRAAGGRGDAHRPRHQERRGPGDGGGSPRLRPQGRAPEELLRAIRAAASGGIGLAPEAAGLRVGQLVAPALAVSDREIQVIRLLAQGLTNRAIARALLLTEATVKTHLVRVYRKLGTDNRTAAVSEAVRRGLVELG